MGTALASLDGLPDIVDYALPCRPDNGQDFAVGTNFPSRDIERPALWHAASASGVLHWHRPFTTARFDAWPCILQLIAIIFAAALPRHPCRSRHPHPGLHRSGRRKGQSVWHDQTELSDIARVKTLFPATTAELGEKDPRDPIYSRDLTQSAARHLMHTVLTIAEICREAPALVYYQISTSISASTATARPTTDYDCSLRVSTLVATTMRTEQPAILLKSLLKQSVIAESF